MGAAVASEEQQTSAKVDMRGKRCPYILSDMKIMICMKGAAISSTILEDMRMLNSTNCQPDNRKAIL